MFGDCLKEIELNFSIQQYLHIIWLIDNSHNYHVVYKTKIDGMRPWKNCMTLAFHTARHHYGVVHDVDQPDKVPLSIVFDKNKTKMTPVN